MPLECWPFWHTAKLSVIYYIFCNNKNKKTNKQVDIS